MRVITGSARGRNIKTLEGEAVRPTAERVKEAVFSILQFELEGRRVLDLFAGSGQLGIEALSRGAASAVFTDFNKAAIAVIKKNLETTGLAENAKVVQTDAVAFLRAVPDVFDIIFIDPPYDSGLLEKSLAYAGEKLALGGSIICEDSFSNDLPEEFPGIRLYRKYKYGKTSVTVYRKDSEISE